MKCNNCELGPRDASCCCTGEDAHPKVRDVCCDSCDLNLDGAPCTCGLPSTSELLAFVKMVRDEQLSHGAHGDSQLVSVADSILARAEGKAPAEEAVEQ